MAGKSYTNRSGKIRLYDGTATPLYLELDFDAGDFTGPFSVPRSEEILKLNRGTADGDAHYVEGPDDKIFEAQQLTFSAMLTSLNQSKYLIEYIETQNGITSIVNGNTIVTTKNKTHRNGVTCPAFADTSKLACNIEILWNEDVDFGLQYNEVHFPGEQQSITEGDDAVTISLTGLWYGSRTRITSFTAGTSVE